MTTPLEKAQARMAAAEEATKLARSQLAALEQKAKARDRVAERKADNKRKILLGSYMLEQMREKPETRAHMIARMDAYLTRSQDRIVFGLAPKSS